jgi:RNase H-fold protein (predicted Holliday junction resolvase)
LKKSGDSLVLPGFVLAVDPGTSKMGWALVDGMGKNHAQGIIRMEGWIGELGRILEDRDVSVVVLGNGTNRSNMEEELSRLLPGTRFAVVDEKESTVEAWQLKRKEEAGGNPIRQVLFLARQLFSPVPVDDYAARILAERFLRKGMR